MAPPAVLGKRVGKRLRIKRGPKLGSAGIPTALEADLGTMVGRALVRLQAQTGNVIELRRGDKAEDWRDASKVYGSWDSGSGSGLAGKIIKNAETGGRIARDLHHVITNRSPRYNPSSEVGPFKVTPNSPNTIRVSAGPDRRTRRQKYEWEKTDTQRKIYKGVLTGAIITTGLATAFVQKRGGIKAVTKEAKGAARRVVDRIRGKAPLPQEVSPLQKKANAMAQKQAAGAEHTATPDAERTILPFDINHKTNLNKK